MVSQGNHITDSLYTLLKESKNKAAILNKIAAEYQYISSSEALKISEDALDAAKKEGNDIETAEAYYNIACNYMSQGSYDTCQTILEKSRTLFSMLNDEEGVLRIDNSIANLNFLKGNLDQSLQQYENNLEKAKKENLQEIQVSAITNIGRIHWLQGRNELALRYYNDALAKADSIHKSYMSGMILLLTGILYQGKGYYELAAENIVRSIEIFERMNYLTKLPYAYNYIGSVYFDLEENENALKYFNKALAFFEQNNDIWGKAVASRFIGRLYEEKNLLDSAQYFFQTSLTLANKLNDINGALYSRRFLGEILLNKGKTDSAGMLFYENLNNADITGNMQEKINNLYDLGRLYVIVNQYSYASNFFHNAGSLADSLGFFYEDMLVNKHLSDLYEKMGYYKNALGYYKIFKSLNDTIFSKEKRKTIDELHLKYETEKKNNEINSLMMEQRAQLNRIRHQRILGYSMTSILVLVLILIAILWLNYKQKQKSNKEKEILLKEIHHRVKNNLQIISSLLSLQSVNISDTKVKDAMKESQDRVKSMALIHQMLYQQDRLSKIDFAKYLQMLAENIASSYGNTGAKINYQIQCDAAELDIDTAIPLGLIANELIVNACKYAFKGRDKGDIIISLTKNHNNKLLFRVRDNGTGMPVDFRIDKAETLGLKLVSLLVRQIRGGINCITEGGTEFAITFLA